MTLGKYSGVEGVTPERLSTQDSLESSAQRLAKQPSSDVYQGSSSPGVPPPGASSRKSVPQEGGGPPPFHHLHRQHHSRPSEGLFARMGKAAKKHSLDEDYLSPPPSASPAATATHPPLSERLSSEPASLPADAKVSSPPPPSQSTTSSSSSKGGGDGREVLRSSTSPGSGRSSLVIGIGGQQQHQQLQHQPRSSSLSEDGAGSTLVQQQEHRVRIQVQNSSSSSSSSRHGPVKKQSSVDKGETNR